MISSMRSALPSALRAGRTCAGALARASSTANMTAMEQLVGGTRLVRLKVCLEPVLCLVTWVCGGYCVWSSRSQAVYIN